MFCVQSRQDGAQGTWRQAGRAPAQPPHTHTHFLGGDLGSPLSSPGLRLPTASTGLVHSLRGREFSLTVNWNGSSWSRTRVRLSQKAGSRPEETFRGSCLQYRFRGATSAVWPRRPERGPKGARSPPARRCWRSYLWSPAGHPLFIRWA